LVVDVVPGGAAAEAGIHPTRRDFSGQVILGDVIIALGGKQIGSVNDLYFVLEQYRIGQTITVTLLREGNRREVKVTLERLS